MNTQLLNKYKYSLFQVEANRSGCPILRARGSCITKCPTGGIPAESRQFQKGKLPVGQELPAGSNLQPPGLELHCRFRSTTPDCSVTKSVSTIPLSWKQAPSQSLVVPVLKTWLDLTKLMDQLIQFHPDVGLAARRFWSLLEPRLCEQQQCQLVWVTKFPPECNLNYLCPGRLQLGLIVQVSCHVDIVYYHYWDKAHAGCARCPQLLYAGIHPMESHTEN